MVINKIVLKYKKVDTFHADRSLFYVSKFGGSTDAFDAASFSSTEDALNLSKHINEAVEVKTLTITVIES